jgi:CRP-like cAMP-binding protein
MHENTQAVDLTAETLGQVNAFRDLTLAERERIVPYCHGQYYEPNQYIVSYKDDSKDVFFIVSGRVQAINFGSSGHQVTLQDLEAGQMFGELSAIDGEPRLAHIITAQDAIVVSMTPDNFMQVLENHPTVIRATLKRLTGMVRLLGKKVYDRDVLPAHQRVRAELLRLAFEQQRPADTAVISPAPTHNGIAYHIGTSRETVTRELNSLRSAGLIMRRGNDLLICDVPRLTQMIGQALEPEKS